MVEERTYQITPELEEHVIWKEFAEPLLLDLAANVVDICHYGFTEMVNNAIDHSQGAGLLVQVDRSDSGYVQLGVGDNGIGIFRKIRTAFNLESDQDAILELAKGKLTTDPRRHSGEGIFFTSRMFNAFAIGSGTALFLHAEGHLDTDWAVDRRDKPVDGTVVTMRIREDSPRTTTEVFDRFASSETDYGFDITRVPVVLVRGEGEGGLVSRSQAKRLVRRLEDFTEIMLDFEGIPQVGQAFADEVFRVWQSEHPDVRLTPVHTTPEVQKMIRRAQARLSDQDRTAAGGQGE